LHLICTYPDKKYKALKKAIGAYTGAEASHIVVGNGSTELIATFIQTISAEHSIIMGPAYSEYEREITLNGGKFDYFPLREEENFRLNLPALLEALTPDVGMFIACNPNNPTGTAIRVDEMRTILEHCKKIGASVMIDETYIEFSDILDDICSIPLVAEFDNLFVIRGTSKFFAAPGIRLGYGMSSNQAFLDRFKTNSDPWSVNSLADFIGQHIFTDFDFHKATQKLVSEERRKAFDELSTWKNIKAFPSEANFILLKLKTDKVTSGDLFEKCIMKKMLIRDASSFTFLDETFLRFCILSPENNAALLKELKSIVEE
ncbi:MAG: aminotransferase class I/II-fold pyridoxal phosphate-dependent enzyme, partial [Anaerotignum sp.]|nr:aminotransferase class I/II-fold pyridoxal phosphate-dependent enzyme [Anaerotignum sp.]